MMDKVPVFLLTGSGANGVFPVMDYKDWNQRCILNCDTGSLLTPAVKTNEFIPMVSV